MQYKDIKQIIDCSITGGLATTLFLLAPLENAFAKGKKANYDFTTNTIGFMREAPTSQKEHPFSVEELNIWGEKYAVLPLPKDKDVKIGEKNISSNVALDFYLIPDSKSRFIIDPNKRSVEVVGEVYVPINITKKDGKLGIANVLEERIMNTGIPLKRAETDDGFKIVTRGNKNNPYDINGVVISGRRYLIVKNVEQIGDSSRQDFIIVPYDQIKIIENKEKDIIQLKGPAFVPIEAIFIEKEEPKKEEPMVSIE